MSPALDKVTSANGSLFTALLYFWREDWPGMIRLCAEIGLGIGPVSQNGRAERREDVASGGGGREVDEGETDLSLIMCPVFVR